MPLFLWFIVSVFVWHLSGKNLTLSIITRSPNQESTKKTLVQRVPRHDPRMEECKLLLGKIDRGCNPAYNATKNLVPWVQGKWRDIHESLKSLGKPPGSLTSWMNQKHFLVGRTGWGLQRFKVIHMIRYYSALAVLPLLTRFSFGA